MADPNLDSKIVKELNKVNSIWQDLLTNIHKEENKTRISAILVQVMIEYYIDRTLVLHSVIKNTNDILRYDCKLDKLKELKLFNDEDVKKFLAMYDIRNIFAHEITIYENRINDIISSANPTSLVINESNFDKKLGLYFDWVLRITQRMFMKTLVKNQENSKTEIDLSFLYNTLPNSEP